MYQGSWWFEESKYKIIQLPWYTKDNTMDVVDNKTRHKIKLWRLLKLKWLGFLPKKRFVCHISPLCILCRLIMSPQTDTLIRIWFHAAMPEPFGNNFSFVVTPFFFQNTSSHTVGRTDTCVNSWTDPFNFFIQLIPVDASWINFLCKWVKKCCHHRFGTP